jgi:hypothetical protein
MALGLICIFCVRYFIYFPFYILHLPWILRIGCYILILCPEPFLVTPFGPLFFPYYPLLYPFDTLFIYYTRPIQGPDYTYT